MLSFEKISGGGQRFLVRMAGPCVFQTDTTRGPAARAIRLLQRLGVFDWIGPTRAGLQARYPIALVATRSPR